jgi:hypothetical protein
LVALSHNEGPIVDEESIFATAQRDERHVAWWVASRLVREREVHQLTVGTDLSPRS